MGQILKYESTVTTNKYWDTTYKHNKTLQVRLKSTRKIKTKSGTKIDTSTIETITADIIANEWPAENVGGPHWKGYGNMNLVQEEGTTEISKTFEV